MSVLPGVIWQGEKITTPGIYAGIPLAKYHGDLCDGHSTSHSGLEKLFGKSAKHYFDQWYGNKDRAERETTTGMVLGQAAHHLFLGEPLFAKHFIRRPVLAPDGRAWNGNNLTCKAWTEAAEKKGLTIFTPEQSDSLTRMARSLSAEPLVQMGILSGHIEQSFVWLDAETGLWMKGRPDVVPNDQGDYADLKTIADISDNGIRKAIHQFGYHRQAALVCEGASILLDQPLVFREPDGHEGFSWTLVFIESARPHSVVIVTLKPEALRAGHRDNQLARRYLKRCIDQNDWPGPAGHQHEGRYVALRDFDAKDDDYTAEQLQRTLAVG